MNNNTLLEEGVTETYPAPLVRSDRKNIQWRNVVPDFINSLKKHWSGIDIQNWRDPAVLLSVVLLSAIAAFSTLPAGALSDEGFHWHQLLQYFSGRFDTVSSLTMFPGFHRTVYGLSGLFSFTEIAEVRYACFLLSIPALLFFFLTSRHYHGNSSYPLSLQLLLCPIIFPFFFLLYTDIPSLAMTMTSLWLVTRRNYQLAALVMGASLLFRQTNIIWLVMIWAMSLTNMGFFNLLFVNFPGFLRKISYFLRRSWLFAVFCALFSAFIYLNGGVAIGDAGNHKLGLYPTQIFLLLFVIFFLFLPLHITNFRKILSRLKNEPLLPLFSVLLFALYILTFDASHGYNSPHMDFFLRNNLLEFIRTSFLTKLLAFIPALIALLSLMVTPLKRGSHYWIYPFMALSLLPIGLIEQRYFIVPIVLFMLFRKPISQKLEYLQATLYVPVTVYIFEGIAKYQFFL
ncbi:Dol-P-Glc:Glc(2)Man(9)GlcNAc(2)-PP-Dol alpha-1,2-glucosyltransferase [Microbulbifer litoralis]|uniref:Dol-P-Glc:Glc(2)Man(9)GlcNAc(2)-PP-Dol alpha-1,2-glucosyltransferase n=1 Tax=Microbulbifer litoralis TaxID=2933965 RepID=UPI002028225E|nr:Dol-P-Glc:Glc(2)Man(9)GlcNAc(2)-PP-Dol alpha-1,2-glucosyltransferase [Microbulbifer sp. GX H0434]